MKQLLLTMSIVFGGQIVWAQNACDGAAQNYQQLVKCAETRSVEVQNALLDVERAKSQLQSAGQWQNPELSAESFAGKINNDDRSETDISLGIPLEIGKISARKSKATSDLSIAETKLLEARIKATSDVRIKLHRLRQLLHEQEIADEAIQTFTKLVNQYAKRPGLSPEQKISSSVFQLSKSEYYLKKADLTDELLGLESYFKLNLGLSVDQMRKALPQSPKSWPKFEQRKLESPTLKQRILQAELDAANADMSLAKAESWPTLTLGPSIKMIKEGGKSDQLIGFNLSFPLPVFNLNGGARSAANALVKINENKRKIGSEEEALRREELIQMYNQSVSALNSTMSHDEIEAQHRSAERLFQQGILPSSLVIEAHRVTYELEKVRHERELKTLQTLIELYALDGNIYEN